MKILAVESSADDLSWAVVEDGSIVVACGMASQTELHTKTGGIVPEVASREHMRTVIPVLEEVIKKLSLVEIDAIAVTYGPGLVGSLLVGLMAAKTLALALGKPLIPVHHIEGHIAANWLERDAKTLQGKKIILTVSGGHNDLYLMEQFGQFEQVGWTLDDAAGEAYDKTARMLGLGYPGGPSIDKFILENRDQFGHLANPYILPRALGEKGSLLFSFSGLKSEVRRQVVKLEQPSPQEKFFLAQEFVEAVTDVLARRLFEAGEKYEAEIFMVTGGVSASNRLKEKVFELAHQKGIDTEKIFFPVKKLYSTDNAAMIGSAAYFVYQHCNERVKVSDQDIITLAPHLQFGLNLANTKA